MQMKFIHSRYTLHNIIMIKEPLAIQSVLYTRRMYLVSFKQGKNLTLEDGGHVAGGCVGM